MPISFRFSFTLLAVFLSSGIALGQQADSEDSGATAPPSSTDWSLTGVDVLSLLAELELRPAPPPVSIAAAEVPEAEPVGEGVFIAPDDLHPLQFEYDGVLFKLHSKAAREMREMTLAHNTELSQLFRERERIEQEIAAKQEAFQKVSEGRLSATQLQLLTEARLARAEADQREFQRGVSLQSILLKIQACDNVTLREGVSRNLDPLDLKQKIEAKQLERLEQFWFFAKPPAVSPELKAQILSLCLNPKSYERYRSGKLCGGFHPDFAVSAEESPFSACRILVCMGCREAIITDEGINLTFDLTEAAYRRLEELADGIYQHRPTK